MRDARSRPGRPLPRLWMALATAIAVVGSLVAGVAGADDAEAVVGTDFNAGNIISDATFYDSGSMSIEQIQAFLTARRPTCRPGNICLKDYTDSFATREANARCGYLQGQRMSAAAIIYWVGRACGINPQSLIVLLEKEQGLVSSDAPSAARYRIAMGYGCPDTAPCDSLYYGFFNQVYNAARQFKVYRDSPGSFRYQAGRTNSVQWHPNAACGASSVYIENQATAGLYNYTPYRPNAAALSNLYGTGDGCSSYGNRNFWRIFSDWFGRTDRGADFVRTSSDPTIWLVSGSQKHRVPSFEVYSALSPIGGFRFVNHDLIDSLPTGKPMNETIRDPQSGAISLVQDGAAHPFPSCELMSLYGFDCADAVDLVPSLLARFPLGAPVGDYFRIGTDASVYRMVDGRRIGFSSFGALTAYAGAAPSYVASMRGEVPAARAPLSRTLMAPLSLVKSPDSARVFLVDGWERRIPVDSLDLASDLASGSVRTERDDVLAGYAAAPAALTPVVSCADTTFLAGTGRLTRVPPADVGAVRTTQLSTDSCGRLPKNPASASAFVKSRTSPVVSILRGGRLQAINDYSTLVSLNGGAAPSIAVLSDTALAAFGGQGTGLAPGSLAVGSDSPQVYLIDGLDRRLPVTELGIPAEFGVRALTRADAAVLRRYTTAAANLTRVWSCGGSPSFGASGQRYLLSASAGTGVEPTRLSDLTCATLPPARGPALTRLFIRASDSSTVYLIESGARRQVKDWAALLRANGGAAPVIPVTSSATLTSFPQGAPLT